MFRAVATGGATAIAAGDRRARGEPGRRETFDFQFFDTIRLEELNCKEVRHWHWAQQAKARSRAVVDTRVLLVRSVSFPSPPLPLSPPPVALSVKPFDKRVAMAAPHSQVAVGDDAKITGYDRDNRVRPAADPCSFSAC